MHIKPHSPKMRTILLNGLVSKQELKEELDIDVRVLGIASSSRMLLSEEGIDLSKWRDDFSQCVSCLPAAEKARVAHCHRILLAVAYLSTALLIVRTWYCHTIVLLHS